jgi:uncharacterized protein (TIGR03437 family)
VGVKLSAGFFAFFLTSFFSLQAAPMLRLASSTVGPVQLATAGATNTQTLEAYNAGDGSLSLTFSASASWVTASTGAPRNCVTVSPANTKTCTPITFTINSSGLPQGLSSATVTVSGDASTVDAPQTVVVLVRIGSVETYAAPGGSRDMGFATSSYVNASAKTTDGANWLTVVNNGAGSFRFNYPYAIHFQPPAGMASGNYSGTVTLAGGSNPTDNQTLPVTMHVTTQPIAAATASTATFAPQPTTNALNIRLAAGAPLLTYPFSANVSVANIGQGSLTVQDPVVTGAWLKPDNVPGYGVVPGYYSIDPTGLAVGSYPGSLAFASNAANGTNGTVTVPVNLEIVAKGNPLIYFHGVLDNATFTPGDTVAQGDILVVKGEQLSFSSLTSSAPPLPTTAGGTSVLVNGTAVPLFYTSYGQIAFQLPYDVATGTAIVQVKRDDGSLSNLASVTVAPRAPRLLVTVNPDYSINSAAHPAHAGDALTVYAIGLGATSPSVAAGAAAPSSEPLARTSQALSVGFGFGFFATEVTPFYAGLTPTAAGLYQVNVAVPSGLPAGAVNMTVSFPGGVVSNVLPLYVR